MIDNQHIAFSFIEIGDLKAIQELIREYPVNLNHHYDSPYSDSSLLNAAISRHEYYIAEFLTHLGAAVSRETLQIAEMALRKPLNFKQRFAARAIRGLILKKIYEKY